MRRGDIFLYSGSGLIPWLIKKVTKSQWSHAGWVTKDLPAARDVVEANAGGVEASPGFPYPIEKCAFIRLKVPQAKTEECLVFAEGKVGAPYDYKLFLGLFWRWIRGWKRKKDVADWSSGYICSELVATPVLQFCGISLAPVGVSVQNTTPEDIWQFATMNPSWADLVSVFGKTPGGP